MLRYCNRRILFFLTALLAFSCQEGTKTVLPPENLATEVQMIEAIMATHILEQQVAESRLSKTVKEDSFLIYQRIIFEEAGIDSTVYFDSYNYYMTQVDQFQQMMQQVTDSLGSLRDRTPDNPTKKEEQTQE